MVANNRTTRVPQPLMLTLLLGHHNGNAPSAVPMFPPCFLSVPMLSTSELPTNRKVKALITLHRHCLSKNCAQILIDFVIDSFGKARGLCHAW